MEKHLICAYCGKEYTINTERGCCPFCGSYNDFTITKSDKFLSKFNKGSKIFRILVIIIIFIIIFIGLKDYLIYVWYNNMYENIETHQYFYSKNYINEETSYIDKNKEVDKSIQITVESEDYDVIELFDEFVEDQFYSFDLSIDLEENLVIKDKNVYIDRCKFYIYSGFTALSIFVEVDDEISLKKGNLYLEDINGNRYLVEFKEGIDNIKKLQDAFKKDFVGEIYVWTISDFEAFKNEKVTTNNFIKFKSIIFEVDGEEYECPIDYENISSSSLIYWGVK